MEEEEEEEEEEDGWMYTDCEIHKDERRQQKKKQASKRMDGVCLCACG